jgi:excisionase family DNA binding protein
MAKMFYTLDEAAERLGTDEQAVKEMAARNELQQFRDRDKLMFKREQVDAIAASGGTAGGTAMGESAAGMSGTAMGASGSAIPLADDTSAGSMGGSDMIDLRDDTAAPAARPEDSREATGVSVFDAGEVDAADPLAQTQVTQPAVDEEDLALESVGSGSGLLDLTRESDDTSLGAELLDEIYPGGEASDVKLDSAAGSSGVFDSAISMETGASGPSGLENLGAGDSMVMDAPGSDSAAAPAGANVYVEPYDPAGSMFGAGVMLGVLAALIIGLIVTISAVAGTPTVLTPMLVDGDNATTLWLVCGGILVLSLVLGFIGLALGKGSAKTA